MTSFLIKHVCILILLWTSASIFFANEAFTNQQTLKQNGETCFTEHVTATSDPCYRKPMAEGVQISKPRNERIEHWLQRATAHMYHAINGQLAQENGTRDSCNVRARRFIHRHRKRGLTWQQTTRSKNVGFILSHHIFWKRHQEVNLCT